MKLTLSDIERITRGSLIQGSGSVIITGISLNSKTIQPGDIFIAIKGKRFDGHLFVKDALKRGARAVIVSQAKGTLVLAALNNGLKSYPIIRVKNTIDAYGLLARFHRQQFRIPVIAITGSAGKTSTKDMLHHVLSARFSVLANRGSENNHIGVPGTLLNLSPTHDVAILEFGTNQPGDILSLTRLAKPNLAVLTNIGESHLKLLKDPGEVFKEKYCLVKGLPENGRVVLNGDDPFLQRIPSLSRKREMIVYGLEGRPQFKAGDIRIDKYQRLTFWVNRRHSFILRTPSVANVYNAMAVIAVARSLGIDYQTISRRLRQFEFTQGRQSLTRFHQFWLIDDTYNANPVSLRSALMTLSFLKAPGRKIFVCADMLELGPAAGKLHREMGLLAADCPLDMILTYGKESVHLAQAVKRRNPSIAVYHYRQLGHVHKKLRQFCRAGDTVLVKGSRGMRMERTVRYLFKHFATI